MDPIMSSYCVTSASSEGSEPQFSSYKDVLKPPPPFSTSVSLKTGWGNAHHTPVLRTPSTFLLPHYPHLLPQDKGHHCRMVNKVLSETPLPKAPPSLPAILGRAGHPKAQRCQLRRLPPPLSHPKNPLQLCREQRGLNWERLTDLDCEQFKCGPQGRICQ